MKTYIKVSGIIIVILISLILLKFVHIIVGISFFIIGIGLLVYYGFIKKNSNNNYVEFKKPNVKLIDEFITIYCNNIFNINKTNRDKNVLIFNENNTNIYIGFVTSYHYSNPQKEINKLRDRYENIYIIILDGEPMDLKNTTPNMIISTKHEKKYFPNNIPIIYIPYFSYIFKQHINISHLKSLVKTSIVKPIKPIKPNFCAFISSNCDESQFNGVKLRLDFFKLLNKRTNGRVHSLGKCFNNFKSKSIEKDNIKVLEPYKFCIYFENEDRYNSEKIIYPIISNCIPIYYGSSIYKKFFNPKRLIDINNYDSFDLCIDHILQIDSDDNLFLDIINEPFLKDNKIDKDLFSFSFGKGLCFNKIWNNLPVDIRKYMNFNSLYHNNIHFITFADGKNYKTDRIMKEAINSKYFDVCKDMRYNINDFMNKHDSFIKNNKRGYGYWIWKHKIILEEYKNLNDNDILIYSDSGNTICNYNFKMIDYLNILINGSGMLFFSVIHKEGIWSKMDTVKYIFPNENDDFIKKILNENQTPSGLMMFRKCKNTTLYLEEVAYYSVIYHLINDDPSLIPNINEFKENRHDQTIFSLVKHKYNFDISYDNLDDPSTSCFYFSRLRTVI